MRFELPGGSLELKTAIERYLRRILSFPFRLWRAATAELPAATDYEGGIVWDATLGRLGVSDGTDWQTLAPYDADVAAYAALTGTGLVTRTGAGTAATRTLTGPAAGLTVTNGNGVAGDPTIALANDLAALEGLAGTGFAQRTGADTWTTVPYEPLTFTPTLRFGGGSTGMAYAVSGREGGGTRVGNRVLFEIYIILTAKGSSTGAATIEGLPATAVAFASGFPWTAAVTGVTVPAYLVSGSTVILRQLTAGAMVNLTHANFTDTTTLVISGSYRI